VIAIALAGGAGTLIARTLSDDHLRGASGRALQLGPGDRGRPLPAFDTGGRAGSVPTGATPGDGRSAPPR
jgi:hypothetical protein